MGKVYGLYGKYALHGKISPKNEFGGIIELEDKHYKYKEKSVGTIDTQFFSGVTTDATQSDVKLLTLGGLHTFEETGKRGMFFKKISYKETNVGVGYGLIYENGVYKGYWQYEPEGIIPFHTEIEFGEVSHFEELTNEYIRENNLRRDLESVYSDYETKKLRPDMQAIKNGYYDFKKRVIAEDTREQFRKFFEEICVHHGCGPDAARAHVAETMGEYGRGEWYNCGSEGVSAKACEFFKGLAGSSFTERKKLAEVPHICFKDTKCLKGLIERHHVKHGTPCTVCE